VVTDGDLIGWEVSGQAYIYFLFVQVCSIDDCEIDDLLFFAYIYNIRFFTVAVVVVAVVVVVVAGRRAELGADAGRICKRQF